VVLGLIIVFAVKPAITISATVVGVFAIFHGYAHGTELPATVNALAYAMGFVISTGMLHLLGIGFGGLTKWPAGVVIVRGAGGVVSLAGIAFLMGVA